jgi:hypothetical protein
MPVVLARCAGLDVHKKTVVVTVLLTDATGSVSKETQTFSTMTAELLRLEAWLADLQVDHLAIESTGVYWYPISNLLEEGRTVLLGNPQHIKAAPGRKTDVRDVPGGSRTGCAMGCSPPASSPPSPSVNCGNSRATASNSSMNAPNRPTGCRKCWRARISRWPPSPPLSWGYAGGPCSTR